jgi:hypothetical protein
MRCDNDYEVRMEEECDVGSFKASYSHMPAEAE